MNFEYHAQILEKLWPQITRKRAVLMYFRYEIYLLFWKRRKLKLGKIIFDIREYRSQGFLLFEEIRIVYVRQDNTEEQSYSLEAWVEYFSWQWDWVNILAFLALLGFIFNQIKFQLFVFFARPWIYFFIRFDFEEYIYRMLLKDLFQVPHIGLGILYNKQNEWFVNVCIDLCSFCNIFF
jgi:hypothetical protein